MGSPAGSRRHRPQSSTPHHPLPEPCGRMPRSRTWTPRAISPTTRTTDPGHPRWLVAAGRRAGLRSSPRVRGARRDRSLQLSSRGTSADEHGGGGDGAAAPLTGDGRGARRHSLSTGEPVTLAQAINAGNLAAVLERTQTPAVRRGHRGEGRRVRRHTWATPARRSASSTPCSTRPTRSSGLAPAPR